MPYISTNVEINEFVEADVDIDDFLSACNNQDIKYIIECLREDGHLADSDLLENRTEMDDVLIKIIDSQIQLTIEEEQQIHQIANRLV